MAQISVIIPLYNGEAFIQPCLLSAARQTHRDLEILVIDDGSTDRGPDVCRELGRDDDRIKLYCQENGGVSAARNRGLELAAGEYVFFLDCDDAIHPLLLEEQLRQMEERGAGIAFCEYRKAEHLEQALAEMPLERPRWLLAEGAEAEVWFHQTYINQLAGIGGKLIRRDLVGDLRFDEELINGEDTWFLYNLICKQPSLAYSPAAWYCYRWHPANATKSARIIGGKMYLESCRRIRDLEWQKSRPDFALTWENLTLSQIMRSFLLLEKLQDQEGCKRLRERERAERAHPLYRRADLFVRLLFASCFFCRPLYRLLKAVENILSAVWGGLTKAVGRRFRKTLSGGVI